MSKIVIDTNVIISSVVYAGKPAKVLDLAIDKTVINIISNFILSEVQEVLLSKFSWQKKEIARVISMLKSFSEMVSPEMHLNAILHEPDNRILECAIAGKAEFIISGDRHLLNLKEYEGINIVDPAAFLEIIWRKE